MSLCEKPFVKDGLAHACGTCQPCRIKRRRIWTHRLTLEAYQHSHNAFVTLTYDDEHLPKNGSVSPRTLQLFLKRLRKQNEAIKIRFYGVGEYGDETLRPHYHVVLFGYPTCVRGQTLLTRPECCSVCTDIKKAWGLGAIQNARAEPAALAYVAGYVTKKIEASPLPSGLHPEFQRMSNRPGIGANAMHDVASVLMAHDQDEELEDVPLTLQHGRSHLPLGRYLRNKLRAYIGRPEGAPEHVLARHKAELSPLRQEAFEASKSFQTVVVEVNQQKRRNLLARYKIRKGRRTL